MTIPDDFASLHNLADYEAYLQSPAYATLDDDAKEVFRLRYTAAAAAARKAAGRRSLPPVSYEP